MIGNTLIELNKVDSTNAYANRLIATTAIADGTVIWAHEQFAGRGQGDHTWSSEPGKNLTFTVCLQPRFLAPDKQFQLNKAVALGVLDFIRSFPIAGNDSADLVPSIKWPNDIYLGNRKTGGILIETKVMGAMLETAFAGIGVNVNQTRFAPGIPNPVSLMQLLRRETGLKDALLSLCRFLSLRYTQLKECDMDSLDHAYDQCLLGFEQWRAFVYHGEQTEGRIRGVDASGRLLVERRSGALLCCVHGEIQFDL